MTDAGRTVGGRYRLGRVIGEGGMSVVYEAEDDRLGRRVAVKILRSAFTADPGFLARFVHEARAAASLSHPNIVAIHDSGSDDELRFIVMELVDGPSLADVLAEHGALPPDRAASIAAQVAEGLAAAHRRGIVHRDVKPGNILLDRRGRALIGDFGIARAFASTALTTTGTILGSIPYLSPEAAVGAEPTPSSDLYSLGVVLFEMLTGRRPFEASTVAAATVRRLHEPPPEPSSIDPSLPPGLDPLVVRAMAIDPGDRFPSARAFAQALDAWRRRWSRTQALVAAGPIVAPVTEAAPNDAPTVASLEEEGDTLVAEPAASATPNGVPARGESDRALARFGPARARRVALPAALTVLGIAAVMVAASVAAFPGSGPSATPPASASGMLSESAAPSLASEVVIALASPTATVTSSASPTPRATPRATPRPTPRPTPAPTLVTTPSRTPRPTAPPVVVVGPAQQVVRFYARVAAHRFAAAADLWSAAMRGRYPPSTYIDGRFANTTRFDIRRASLTSRSGDQAIVAVDVVEHRSTSPTSEHWVGSWRLVRHAGTWLLDDPNLASA